MSELPEQIVCRWFQQNTDLDDQACLRAGREIVNGLAFWTDHNWREEAWRCYVESGADPDWADARHLNLGEAVEAVRELRKDYEEALKDRDEEGYALAEAREMALLALRNSAMWLLKLKDGPRDLDYTQQKPRAWESLRQAVARANAEVGEPMAYRGPEPKVEASSGPVAGPVRDEAEVSDGLYAAFQMKQAEAKRLKAALETIRMGTNPGVETEGEAQDNPVLTRAVIHEVASRALSGSVGVDGEPPA